VGEFSPTVLANAITGTARPFKGQLVKKRGFRTRVTHGLVIDVNVTHAWAPKGAPPTFNAFLLDQAVIQGTDLEKNLIFADEGDSGAIVLDSDKATGLLWATDGRRGIMSPIDEVASRLNIRMVW
jgi:hypothetical protein